MSRREYLCTHRVAGRIYGRSVWATSWDEAEQQAATHGWRLDGELVMRSAADSLPEAMSEAARLLALLDERDAAGMAS